MKDEVCDATLSSVIVDGEGGHITMESIVRVHFKEIILSKNFAVDNLRQNFTEVLMNANKVNPKIWLLSVNFEKFTSINLLACLGTGFSC